MSTTDATPTDRQRQRESRGVGARGSSSQRLPSPPRRRRPAMAALAVLLIVGGALAAGLLAIRMDSREAVLVLAAPVEPGQQITKSMLRQTRVSGEDVRMVPAGRSEKVIGSYATTHIAPHQLLTASMFTQKMPIAPDQAIVGALLQSGQYPAKTLRAGDKVQIIRIGKQAGQPPKPLTEAIVLTNRLTSGENFSGGQSAVATTTLIVPRVAVEEVVNAAGHGFAGFALVSRNNSIEHPDLQVLSSAVKE